MISQIKMKKYLKSVIVVALLLVTTLSVSVISLQPAFAAPPPCPKTSVIPLQGDCNSTKGVSTNPIFNLLVYFIRFLSFGVGLAVAGGIIWGGMLYGTARGNAAQTQKGVIVIVNAVVGLLLYLFMFALLNFFIPGGILS